MSECKSCGARVRWVRTAGGKAMPLDAIPHPRGNVFLVNGVARVKDNGSREEGTVYYRCHFATCPKAQAISKRGRRGGKPKPGPQPLRTLFDGDGTED